MRGRTAQLQRIAGRRASRAAAADPARVWQVVQDIGQAGHPVGIPVGGVRQAVAQVRPAGRA